MGNKHNNIFKRDSILYVYLFLDVIITASVFSLLVLYHHHNIPLHYKIFIILFVSSLIITYSQSDIYNINANLTLKCMKRIKALISAIFIILLIGFFTKTSTLYSRKIILIGFVSSYIMQVIFHLFILRFRLYFNKNKCSFNALVIGTGKTTDYLCHKINNNVWSRQNIIGILTDDLTSQTENNDNKVPILGDINDIIKITEEYNIRSVYISIPLQTNEVVEYTYEKLLDYNVNIYWVPNLFSMKLINHHVTEVSNIPVIVLSETPLTGINYYLKYFEDKLLSLTAIILLFPFLAIIAIIIKIDSKGPIIYKQCRTGWDGKEFFIYKFRSMKINCCDFETDKIDQATEDDHRFTRLGKFLRRTSIDELPQIFNVIKGEMSIVGPRPHAVAHNVKYAKKIDAYLARHRMRPGITGLAQVRGYRGETKTLIDMEQRINSDIEYINNWSIFFDISIIIRTIFILFKHKAY